MKRRLAVLYVLYGIGVTLLFTVTLFPGDEAALYVRDLWNRRFPSTDLTMKSLSPGMPAALQFEEAAVRWGDGEGKVIHIDRVRLGPGFSSLIRGYLAVLFSGEAFGGRFSGRVRPEGRLTAGGPFSLEVTVRDLDMENLRKAGLLGGRSLKGLMSGEFSYSGMPGETLDGEGKADFLLKKGTIGLYGDILGLTALPFDSFEGLCFLKDRTVRVEKVSFSGNQVTGAFEGNVYLARDLERSRIALTGTIRIPPLNRAVTTVIGGTAAAPTVRLK